MEKLTQIFENNFHFSVCSLQICRDKECKHRRYNMNFLFLTSSLVKKLFLFQLDVLVLLREMKLSCKISVYLYMPG